MDIILLLIIVSLIGLIAILWLGLANVGFLFYAWIVTLPFAQSSLYDMGSMNLYVDRLILPCLLFFSLLYISMRKIALPKISIVEVLMLGFTLVCLVSARRSNTLDRIGLAMLLNAYIYPFVGYYMARMFFRNEKDVWNLSIVVTCLGLYLAYTGICEQVYPGLVFPRYIVSPDFNVYGRSVGPFGEPIGYGLGLLYCFLLSLYLFFNINNWLSRNKIVALINILMAPIAIFFTYTRAVWIGLGLSLFILFLFYPHKKKIFGSALVILIIGFMLIQTVRVSQTEGSTKDVVERDTIWFRISMAKTGMKMFLRNPVLGIGQFRYSEEFPSYYEGVGTSIETPPEGFVMHNTFLNILAELGVIGFIPFVLILAYVIKDGIVLYRKSTPNRDIAIIFLASMSVFIFAGMANNMEYKFAHVLLFSMAGMTNGLLREKTLPKERPMLIRTVA